MTAIDELLANLGLADKADAKAAARRAEADAELDEPDVRLGRGAHALASLFRREAREQAQVTARGHDIASRAAPRRSVRKFFVSHVEPRVSSLP